MSLDYMLRDQVNTRQLVPICQLSSAARRRALGCQLWDYPAALQAHSFVPRSTKRCIAVMFSMIADGCGRAPSHVNLYPGGIHPAAPLALKREGEIGFEGFFLKPKSKIWP